MNPDPEVLARASWQAQVTHRHTHECPNGTDWHPQVVEAWSPPGTDHYLVGDVWWLHARPTHWLLDWHAHPGTTALIVVTNGTMRSASRHLPVHLVACVTQAGHSVALTSPDDQPPRRPTRLQGSLYSAMLQAMSPAEDDALAQELATITR